MARKTTTAATTTPTIKLTRGVKGFVKKIGGRVRWLAPLDQPELAMQRAVKMIHDHGAGVAPAPPPDRIALADVCDLFLARKDAELRAGELKPRTFSDYQKAVQRCSDHFGAAALVAAITPGEWGRYRDRIVRDLANDPHSQLRFITPVRMMSGWAFRNEIIDRPFRFGDSFKPPAAAALRKPKRTAGKRMFTPDQVKKILDAAPQPMRCMFLLSLNAGFGNTDVARLPLSAVHLDKGVIEFDRPKTGVERRCVLWPETIADLRAVIAARPKVDSDLVFITPRGHPYVRDNFDADGKLVSTTDAVSANFWKLMKHLKIDRAFYDGRRTFRTFADEVRDERAADVVMGHTPNRGDMGSHYVQEISLDRLAAISNHVRERLGVGGSRTASPASSASASRARAPRRTGKSRR